jgi:hypothetical protein
MEWGNWGDPGFRDAMQMLQRGAIAEDQRRQNKQLLQKPPNKCGGIITKISVANRLFEELGLDAETSLPVILECGFCKTASVAATSCPWCGDDNLPWVITRKKELACKRCDKCWVKQKCPHCGKANPSLNLKLLTSPNAIKFLQEINKQAGKDVRERDEHAFAVWGKMLAFFAISGICFCLYHLVTATTIPPRFWGIVGLVLFSLLLGATQKK